MSGERFEIRKWNPLGEFALDERATRLIGSRTGIIARLFETAVSSPEDPKLFNVMADHSRFGRMLGLPTEIDLRAGGTGLSLLDAFYRAVGEVVERYCLLFYDEESLIFDSYVNLERQGLRAVSPEDVQFFSKAQLASEDSVFTDFTEDMPLGWAEGVSLVTGEPVLVPAQWIYFAYYPMAGERRIIYASSSGCACASSMEEALLKGLYECVERDAIMITWYGRISPPVLDIDSNSYLKELFETRGFCEHGRQYNLLYATLDIDIPVVLGVGELVVGGQKRQFVGGACNLDPEEAAFSALLELGQGVPFVKQTIIRTPFPRYADMEFKNFDDNIRYYTDPANVDKLDFLLEGKERVDIGQLPDRSSGDALTDLRTVVKILEDHGLEPIAFEHTTEDIRERIGFHVGRVIVPGLMQLSTPRDPFLGNRRLYEVPVKLGLKTEDMEINPNWHPYP